MGLPGSFEECRRQSGKTRKDEITPKLFAEEGNVCLNWFSQEGQDSKDPAYR
jgi:hypothetical protein